MLGEVKMSVIFGYVMDKKVYLAADNRITDAEGKFIQTGKLTDDERSAAANYMAFIMKEYRKTIASDKQYGISISSITETNTGDKICPWTSKYNRNGMYEGIVEGLK